MARRTPSFFDMSGSATDPRSGAAAPSDPAEPTKFFGLLSSAVSRSKIPGRAAVSTRPTLRSQVTITKTVADMFAPKESKGPCDLMDCFNPTMYTPVPESDVITSIFTSMAMNYELLKGLAFHDVAAVASMSVLGLSTGLMAREQFKVDSGAIPTENYADVGGQWLRHVIEISDEDLSEAQETKLQECFNAMLGAPALAVVTAWLQSHSPRAWMRLHSHRVFGPSWNPCKVQLDAGYCTLAAAVPGPRGGGPVHGGLGSVT
eukprot:Skav221638  [mRNA]  locus=scaffold335:86230:96277:- [translate_table: standard]